MLDGGAFLGHVPKLTRASHVVREQVAQRRQVRKRPLWPGGPEWHALRLAARRGWTWPRLLPGGRPRPVSSNSALTAAPTPFWFSTDSLVHLCILLWASACSLSALPGSDLPPRGMSGGGGRLPGLLSGMGGSTARGSIECWAGQSGPTTPRPCTSFSVRTSSSAHRTNRTMEPTASWPNGTRMSDKARLRCTSGPNLPSRGVPYQQPGPFCRSPLWSSHTDRCRPELHTKPKTKSTRAPGLAIEYASRRRLSMQLQTSLILPFVFTLWHMPCMFTMCVPKCLAKDPSVSRRPLVSTTGPNHTWSALGEPPV